MHHQNRPIVFVHVGAPKSGTTYLQRTLWGNRQLLRRHGLLYPGNAWEDHVFAALALREITFQGHANPRIAGSWRRLVREVEEWGGPRAIIDQELLAAANERQVARALDMLSFAEVHIVCTLRDTARVLPAAWQEWVRNREVDTYADFLAAVRGPRPGPDGPWTPTARMANEFWRHHDAVATLARWGASLPPEQVHVVTVPQSGAPPDTLWNRFAEVLGIADLALVRPTASNPSLAAPAAAVLHDLNRSVGGKAYPWSTYDRVVKHAVAPALAAVRGARIELPEDDFAWAREVSVATAEALGHAGYRVHGDLADLHPTARPDGIVPDAATTDDRLAVAMAGLTAFARTAERDERNAAARIAQLETEVGRLRLDSEALAEHRALPPLERVKRCVVELSAEVAWLQRLLGVYRRARRGRAADAA
ncbi:hypothetical protein [Jatrophihabitans fulvus]